MPNLPVVLPPTALPPAHSVISSRTPRLGARGRAPSRHLAGTDLPLRLIVVEGHPLARRGLLTLFSAAPHVQVVGEAGTAADALLTACHTHPNVVVMNAVLPDRSGIQTCHDIRSKLPGTHVVILTSLTSDDAVISAMLAGASGYLLTSSQPESLIAAVENAGDDGLLLDPAVTDSLAGRRSAC